MRLAALWCGASALVVRQQPTRRRLRLAPRMAVTEIAMPALSSTMTSGRVVSWLVGKAVEPQAVYLDYEPVREDDEYRFMFDCPTHYNSDVNQVVYLAEATGLRAWADLRTFEAGLLFFVLAQGVLLIMLATAFGLRLGRALIAVGRVDEGRERLQAVIEQFPGSAAAGAARRELEGE